MTVDADLRSSASLMAYVGPKHEAFVNDQRLITAIMGPYGSAKTTGCIRKIIASVLWQEPQADGVRRARWCCVRDTYDQLKTNVLNSWFGWFPQTKENWHANDMLHKLRFDVMLGDKWVPIELEMYFRAMGDHKAEDVLKGMELTGLWLNETDTLSRDCFLFGFGRTGRYPSKKDGGCAWRGVIMDFNAPDIDNWVVKLVVEKKLGLSEDLEAELRAKLGPRFGVGFYEQPGGLSKDPVPENLQNLPDGYYEGLAMAFASKPNHLRRFVHNRFGAVSNGQPVFPEFNSDIHVSKEPLQPIAGYPIDAGLDGGRTPAMIFYQTIKGQMRVLDELVIYDPSNAEQLMRLGPKAFAELARDFVAERYGKSKLGTIFYDPAIDFGQDDDEEDWLRFFRKEFKGVRFKAGGRAGNRLEPRLESVRTRLVKLPGGQPGMLISNTCHVLIRAFSAGYVIARVEMSNDMGRFQDKPQKNDFSHVMDATQYGSLGADTRADILDDIDGRARAMPHGKVHHGGYAAAGMPGR